MHFWHTIGRALGDELRLAGRAIRDRRLALLLGLFAGLLLLASQAPLSYRVDVGVEDGPGSDLPLVAGFHPRERDIQGTFRWTRSSSEIRLPGVGVRPLQLTLRFIAVSPEVAERGPREIELWANGTLAMRLPVRPQGAVYRVALPPAPGGAYLLELRSATFVPSGDERSIGAGLSAFGATAPAGPALPPWRNTLIWLAAAALGWLALCRAGFEPSASLATLLPLAALAALAALLDPPRFAFGAEPALAALGLGWLLAILLGRARPAVVELLGRLGIALPSGHWRWLTLMAVAVLATRYGGKIYPDSMPGDIGFHANRFVDVAYGTVLIVSRNRGVDFPYPPALYLLLMPLSLAGVDRRVALQLGGALLDALSPFLVYVIGAALVGRAWGRGGALSVPLVAAAIYSFSAAGLMTTWWNFSTHIFTQFTHLLLIAALVLLAPLLLSNRRPTTDDRRPTTDDRRPMSVIRPSAVVAVLVLLQCLVYLGHFGFWMNMSLLGAFGLAALLVARRRSADTRWGRAFWPLLAAFVVAEGLAALLFYTGYTGMLLAQAQAAATGGLTGLAGRPPQDRAVLWQILWDFGLRTHFGFFPLPLALCGGLLAALGWPRAEVDDPIPSGDSRAAAPPVSSARRGVVLALMAGTLLIALFFAALPFLSGSTLSSRWLMFSAWAVAVGAALGAAWLWRRGAAGRLVAAAAGCYVVWITASMWLAALAWRVRPPEPF
jgi:hypothetical protein